MRIKLCDVVTVKFCCGFKGNKDTLSIILQCIKHILHINHSKIELHNSRQIEKITYCFVSNIDHDSEQINA